MQAVNYEEMTKEQLIEELKKATKSKKQGKFQDGQTVYLDAYSYEVVQPVEGNRLELRVPHVHEAVIAGNRYRRSTGYFYSVKVEGEERNYIQEQEIHATKEEAEEVAKAKADKFNSIAIRDFHYQMAYKLFNDKRLTKDAAANEEQAKYFEEFVKEQAEKGVQAIRCHIDTVRNMMERLEGRGPEEKFYCDYGETLIDLRRKVIYGLQLRELYTQLLQDWYVTVAEGAGWEEFDTVIENAKEAFNAHWDKYKF